MYAETLRTSRFEVAATKSKSTAGFALAFGLALSTVACGSSDAASPGAGVPSTSLSNFGVTADWLDHKLSIFDYGALIEGAASRDDVLIGEVDLSAYEQGPLEVKITPDGKTALVSASPGFFTIPGASALLVGASTVPTGPSFELFVNLETRKVETELDVGDGPSGIAITHDGSRAFVSHAGSANVTIIDMKARKVTDQIDVGGTFAEAIAIDDTDTVGIVACIMAGTVSKGARTFALDDMAGTLSEPIPLDSDAAGVPFFPGTKTAYVVLSYNPLSSPTSGYAVIDASNPASPVMLAHTAFTDATYVDFQAIPSPKRGTVLVPISLGGNLSVREYSLGESDVVVKDNFDIGPVAGMGAFGLVTDDSDHVVMTTPGDKNVVVLDLHNRDVITVPWANETGPMGIDRH